MSNASSDILQAVLTATAPSFKDDLLQQFSEEQRPALSTLISLVLGLPSPLETPRSIKTQWEAQQKLVLARVDELRPSSAFTGVTRKRQRDEENGKDGDSAGVESGSQKRIKGDTSSPAPVAITSGSPASALASTEDDPPLFTLHALSMTSPVRKKADITVHRLSIRLTQPGAPTPLHPPIPTSALRRAFLLPTRGKSKPHWTILMLPTDTPPVANAKSKGKGKLSDSEASDDPSQPQITFGLDAVPTGLRSTKYEASADDSEPSGTTNTLPKGSPVLPILRDFLSQLPIPTLEPSITVFRSAMPGGAGGRSQQEGVAGIDAYRGAKPGTLWFLDEGVLWDGRPAEFFSLRDLARPSVGEGGVDIDGIRTYSVTGRTCSVIVRRNFGPGSGARVDGGRPDETGDDEVDEGDNQDDQAIDVDFSMVDGREQEGIARWVKHRRHLFGQVPEGGAGRVEGGAQPKPEADGEDEDEDDSDFVDGSSSDDGSATSDSEIDSDDQGDEAEKEGESEGTSASDQDEEVGEPDGEDAEELDPKHHPLLRPGAMPRMSRAAVEAVVSMVEADMLGKPAQAEGDSEDELDELDE
ncbi:hypothetical protein CERSUDRAFT_118499 [Gelatoporia subvermispora B]|uniref:Histone chaperone RTT106/FACT complex subunit SPT16-like middle domain-containing protein n=1 Tax=Ceriporiopsis subvermispora (strain B) TaxID=914234 RepID=M2PB53_CERS8|nr:hypothetical protein CERSUDRAFT_118499 [Gelatoporia subvermispora B]